MNFKCLSFREILNKKKNMIVTENVKFIRRQPLQVLGFAIVQPFLPIYPVKEKGNN